MWGHLYLVKSVHSKSYSIFSGSDEKFRDDFFIFLHKKYFVTPHEG